MANFENQSSIVYMNYCLKIIFLYLQLYHHYCCIFNLNNTDDIAQVQYLLSTFLVHIIKFQVQIKLIIRILAWQFANPEHSADFLLYYIQSIKSEFKGISRSHKILMLNHHPYLNHCNEINCESDSDGVSIEKYNHHQKWKCVADSPS